jgi:hypothetical protein
LPGALREAAVVPDPTATASPVATATATSDVTVIVGSDFTKSSPPASLDHS